LSWTTQELSGYEAIPGEYTLFLLTVAFGQMVNVAAQMGFHSPTFKLYFMPFDYALRLDLQPKMETATKMVAMTATGLIMMVLLWIPYVEVAHYLILLLATAIATIWVVLKMHNEHREKIKNALTAQQQEVAAQRKVADKTIAQELYEKIPNAPDMEVFSFKMNMLEILDPVLFRARIPELLSPKKEHFQKEALILANDFCLLETIPVLDQLLQSPYFPTFRYGEMIEKIYSKLRGAEFRLERIQYIEQLTFSKIEEERIFGASLTYYADSQHKPNLLLHLLRDDKPKVEYRAIISSAKTSAPEIQGYLLENLAYPIFSNAVVSAVVATGDALLSGLENIFTQSGVPKNLQMNVLHAYSLIGTEKVIEALWRKIESSDEAIKKKAMESLSRCGVTATGKYYDIVEKQLDEACKILIWNTAALLSIPDDNQYNLLKEAIREEIASNNYWIFKYLSLMFDSNSIELVRKNIRSKKSEESEFAKELLELVLPAQFELKQYLNILLSPASEEEKLDKTQNFWPIEPMPMDEVLKELLYRDYKSVNHWTKACAMILLAKQNKEAFIPIFAAQFTNPHFMVKELAAFTLHEMGKDAFEPYNTRFEQEPANWLQARFQELDNLPVLKFDVINEFKNIPFFAQIDGALLSDIAVQAKLRKVYQGEIVEKKPYIQDFNYFVVYSGAVALRKGKQLMREYYEKQFIHTLDILNDKSTDYELVALNDVVVYELKREEINQWMLLREEVAKSFLKLIEKKEKVEKV
jgi:Ca2+/Na+ antiporter